MGWQDTGLSVSSDQWNHVALVHSSATSSVTVISMVALMLEAVNSHPQHGRVMQIPLQPQATHFASVVVTMEPNGSQAKLPMYGFGMKREQRQRFQRADPAS